MKDLSLIQNLVGTVSAEQLRYVDCAVNKNLGVFMPLAGQCYYAITPEHTHPAYMFLISFDSNCRTKFSGRTIQSHPSTVVMIPPDMPHQELPCDIIPRYFAVMINKSFFESHLSLYKTALNPDCFGRAFKVNDRIVSSVKEFLNEYEDQAPGYELLLHSSAQTITHLLIRLLLQRSGRGEKISFRMSINRAVEFIWAHYGEKMTLADLSRVACLSPSHFARLFKTETGLSPGDYILKTRLDCAKRMIRAGDYCISEIALRCGFNSSSYFSHCFRREFSQSPLQFKKQWVK
ncbi:AraC family transcriptional regulator [Chitinispirillales bacterium ANBcel5]|uniref:helix-turn-helix domain-containing protein n=1 Tax=Cellulosispirillum alkaliphilum TaxID=3039283 RepID=UPI002A4EBF2C|nr:AraC family transcriptional regulator [Chitinispirillales bacterium ANBcel5]